MNHSHNLNDVLATLRQEHRSIEAPASMEAHLVEETHRMHPARLSIRTWVWAGGLGLAAAAASIIAIASWNANHPIPHPIPVAHTGSPVAAPNTTQPLTNPSTDVPNAVAPSRATTPVKHNRHIQSSTPSDGFFPLPSSEGLPSPSAASVVMMQIHTDALRQYGLELPPTAAPRTIVAEFIVGEDGLPRSIRILQ